MIPTQRQPLIDTFRHHNSQINLSSFNDPETIWHKHIWDSLQLLTKRDLRNKHTLLDRGTGWWFPLLPLALSCPWLTCIWCDSVRKKTIAVQSIADTLWLSNVTTLWSRGEKITTQFDVITARAVAYADKLLPLILPKLLPTGTLFLYKMVSEEEDRLIRSYPGITIADTYCYEDHTGVKKIIYAVKRQKSPHDTNIL